MASPLTTTVLPSSSTPSYCILHTSSMLMGRLSFNESNKTSPVTSIRMTTPNATRNTFVLPRRNAKTFLPSSKYYSRMVGLANGGAHLPAPDLHDHHSEQAYQRLQKAAIQRSAEGAGQVQRVLAAP